MPSGATWPTHSCWVEIHWSRRSRHLGAGARGGATLSGATELLVPEKVVLRPPVRTSEVDAQPRITIPIPLTSFAGP